MWWQSHSALAADARFVSPQRPRPMAQVVLLKGINVGGHRTFRPSTLANALARFGAINVGAAGTLIIHKRVSHRQLRAEIGKHLPFKAEIVFCAGRDILSLVSQKPFDGKRLGQGVVPFVSVVAHRSRPTTRPPLALPPTGRWSVKFLAYQHPFVLGLHRREMRAISYLGQLEEVVGAPMTIRSWRTIESVASILQAWITSAGGVSPSRADQRMQLSRARTIRGSQ